MWLNMGGIKTPHGQALPQTNKVGIFVGTDRLSSQGVLVNSNMPLGVRGTVIKERKKIKGPGVRAGVGIWALPHLLNKTKHLA